MNEQLSTRAGTAALVLGILGWVTFLSSYRGSGFTDDLGDSLYYQPISILGPVLLPPLAIVFGHIGLRRAQAGARCRGRAITALVLGYLLLVFAVARVVAAVTAN